MAVATALPQVQRDLDLAPIDAQWILSAYGLLFGSSLLLGGRLGDLYGHRRVLTAGLTLFAAGSVLAGLAPTIALIIGARALQGLGAAAAMPAALALIGSLYPPGPRRARALSLLAAMATIGIMSGLVIGGVITDLLGWRWVLLLLAIPAVAAVMVAPHALDDIRAGPRVRLDVVGAVLVGTGFLAVLYGLASMERSGLASPQFMVSSAVGIALLISFYRWERRADERLFLEYLTDNRYGWTSV